MERERKSMTFIEKYCHTRTIIAFFPYPKAVPSTREGSAEKPLASGCRVKVRSFGTGYSGGRPETKYAEGAKI